MPQAEDGKRRERKRAMREGRRERNSMEEVRRGVREGKGWWTNTASKKTVNG